MLPAIHVEVVLPLSLVNTTNPAGSFIPPPSATISAFAHEA